MVAAWIRRGRSSSSPARRAASAGRSCALCCERGARSVVAADLDGSGVERLSEELGAARVVPRALDVCDEAATRALVEEVERTIGAIDVWFANAGLATGSGPEATDEEWQRQWRVNVMSHVYAARALLPGWIERGEGHLVTTASMAGILTTVGDAAYSATKHAAVGLRRVAGVHLRRHAGCACRASAPAPSTRRCSGRAPKATPPRRAP